MAMGFEIIQPQSEEELTKEKQEQTLTALLNERAGYEARLAAAQDNATPDKNAVHKLESRIAGVNAELNAIGEHAEPRSKIRK
jgi:hypothetical protein